MLQTNLKNNLIKFSKGWESYVEDCMRLHNDKFKFYVTKDHAVYELLIKDIVADLQSIVDQRIYKIKSSVGQSSLTGIPWLSVMDKQITESTQEGFYISYLFSKNARQLHLSLALGATQFEELFGANSKTTEKITKAKQQFVQNFHDYAPSNSFDEMDLLDLSDESFIRDFTPTMNRIADYYLAGSFFTKTYDLVNPKFSEEDFVSDLKIYIDSYRKVALNPTSTALLSVLDESVIDETDLKENKDFNYALPLFNPKVLGPKIKSSSKGSKSLKSNHRISKPSKKVGDAGEKYVFEYETNKLIKSGRQDLAKQIVKQYDDLTHFPGYDIKSFDENGNTIFIEVKSSKSKKKNYFEISENELKAAKELGDQYYIYQVTNALINPRISNVIKNIVSYQDTGQIRIEAMSHRISFKDFN